MAKTPTRTQAPTRTVSLFFFTTTGADCDPVLVISAGSVRWNWHEGDYYDGANPGAKTFAAGAATREHHVTTEDGIGIITQLIVGGDSISVLDVSALTGLTLLWCYSNSISVLDVSALTGLTDLRCYTNSISVLDVSALTGLTSLRCYSNNLSVLDVSALTGLTYLRCYSNNLSVLDVSALTPLTYLICNDNSLPEAQVNAVLIALDANGLINGMVNISGNAAPTGAGITAKNALIANGWTVTTD